MGNTVPIGDERVERCTDMLKLTKRDISYFWKVFQQYDKEREGTIPMDTFFTEICKEKRNLFGDAIFDLIDTEDTDTIEFGEFVQVRRARQNEQCGEEYSRCVPNTTFPLLSLLL